MKENYRETRTAVKENPWWNEELMRAVREVQQIEKEGTERKKKRRMLRGKVHKTRSEFWNKAVQSAVSDRDVYKIAKWRVPLPSAEIKALQGHKNKSKEEQVMVITEALLKPEKPDEEEDEADASMRSAKSRKECKWEDLTEE